MYIVNIIHRIRYKYHSVRIGSGFSSPNTTWPKVCYRETSPTTDRVPFLEIGSYLAKLDKLLWF